MAISVFPAGGGGEFVTNDFVVDMNETENNVIDLGRAYASGAYDISLASGDTTFDIYALDADGNSVAYTNDATMVTTGEFTTLVILGVATDERITFAFSGASNDATSEGDAPGAGAYLESINPSDLPNQDDTANIIGGNFATDVEIYFESGTVSTEAKNVVRSDSTALVVTRPDVLDPALDPWDVKAINPGVTPPTGSDVHILPGTVDAGATPVWTTTSPLTQGTINSAYSATVVATDADGSVEYSITAGSLPTGLSLNSSTGVISGTPTTGAETFTVQASDEGGNTNDREFSLPILLATGGTISTVGNYTVHKFESSDDFIAFAPVTAEYLIVAGGGGGGGALNTGIGNTPGGGGGGGGYLSSISGETGAGGSAVSSPITISAGTVPIVVGSGGTGSSANAIGQAGQGGDSSITGYATAIGGGGGGAGTAIGGDGGSGGGAGGGNYSGGNGTSGQGFDGGNSIVSPLDVSGAGGGAGGAGSPDTEVVSGITSSATGTSVENANGGGGATNNSSGDESNNAGSGAGGKAGALANTTGASGRTGIVIVRYE